MADDCEVSVAASRLAANGLKEPLPENQTRHNRQGQHQGHGRTQAFSHLHFRPSYRWTIGPDIFAVEKFVEKAALSQSRAAACGKLPGAAGGYSHSHAVIVADRPWRRRKRDSFRHHRCGQSQPRHVHATIRAQSVFVTGDIRCAVEPNLCFLLLNFAALMIITYVPKFGLIEHRDRIQ
jgi:hypothetical protein